MKYILLFCGSVKDQERWGTMSEDQLAEMDTHVGDWITKHSNRLGDRNRLHPPHTAKTVRHNADGSTIVTDGPFAESGEVVGGYAIVTSDDFDEVLEMAKTWPAGPVEIRPVME